MRRQQRMIAPDHFHHQMMENDDDDDDYSIPIPISSGPKKPPATTGDDGIMELLWKNGHVVMQNQNQRHSIPPPADRSDDRLLGAEVFMHEEDEMASWIQYPIDDLYADLLYPVNPPPPIPNLAQIRSPLTLPDDVPRLQNFVHFSRPPPKPRTEAAVESTTMVQPNVVVERVASATAGESTAGTCDLTVLSSSPDGSRGSFSNEGRQRPPEDRKRKARGNDDDEYQSEDIFEFEAAEPKKKKPRRSSTSTKRSRAAEVHNQSERRRRDRINEKMRALQELIPRCNKSDKASMLDEAIEYLKSLQMQVQMMSSMGCPVVPMMYPGMQQYMSPAMGLGMGLNRPPILPYPSIPNVGPRFPMMPAVPYCIPPQVPIADPSRAHTCSETDRLAILKNLQARMPSNIVDPYQQFVGMQFPLPQNQAGAAGTKLSSRGNPDNQPFGK